MRQRSRPRRCRWWLLAIAAAMGVGCTPLKSGLDPNDRPPDAQGSVRQDAGLGSTPNTTPIPPDYAGTWTGLTSQSRLFRFSVFASAVTRMESNWRVEVPATGCVATGGTETTFATPVMIADGKFVKGPVGGDPVTFTVDGDFRSTAEATGSLQLTYARPNCTGTLMLSWQARKVVCGNGTIEWPETCDDGNRTPEDGCSEVCQLPAIVEREPNDSPASASATGTADFLVVGAIATPTDRDVFPVTNSYPGPIAVAAETFGQTPGTCEIATRLEVLDATGTVLAEDTDGSRALYCSAMSFAVRPGETVFLRVGSADGKIIPSYGIHVRFQRN